MKVTKRKMRFRPPVLGVIDGQKWWICPLGGPECGRVKATVTQEWIDDVMSVHMQLHHTYWR